MRLKPLVFLLAFTFTLPVLAQDDVHCDLADTPAVCWHRFVPALPELPDVQAIEAAKESDAAKAVSTANTGAETAPSGAGSALKDFLSLLSFALDTSSLSQNGQTLVFDWNPRLNGTQPLKLQAALANPTVSGSVSSALASNPAALTSLNESLASADEITVSGTYTLVSSSHGRSIEPHRGYFRSLQDAVLTDTDKADDEVGKALQAGQLNPSKSFKDMNPDAKVQVKLMRDFEAAARANGSALDQADRLTRAFATLLNNQPQFYVSGSYRERTPVAGPDEVMLKASYEYGFKNLNTFRRYVGTCNPLKISGDSSKAAASECVDLLEKYAGDPGGPDIGRDSGRVAFSLEYHWAQANTVSLPQYALQLQTDEGHSFVVSASYGAVLAPRPDRKSGRLDVTMSYEDISNAAAIPSITDPSDDIKDRWVGSITYTQKISDTLSFPLSLVYANHASYLPDVDRALNAHFGLLYKMPSR